VPIYEYRCCECSEILSKLHAHSDWPLETIEECPCCKEKNCHLEKLMSTCAIRVKGGGSKQNTDRKGSVNFTPNRSQRSSYSKQ